MFQRQIGSSVLEVSHKLMESPNQSVYFNHIHNHCEILLFIRGQADYNIDGQIFSPSPYDLLFIPAATYHYLIPTASVPYENYVIGIDPQTVIPYIERNDEGCAAFLDRLLTLEGAALKCLDGKFMAIGYEYAQNRNPSQIVTLSANQEGTKHRRDGTSYKKLTIKTPYAGATAKDEAVAESHMQLVISGTLPAMNDIQAGRWARGKLFSLNRQCESLVMGNTFNAGLAAMTRIDVDGDTDATGEWIVDEVEHDMINLTTTATMRRCIWSIR